MPQAVWAVGSGGVTEPAPPPLSRAAEAFVRAVREGLRRLRSRTRLRWLRAVLGHWAAEASAIRQGFVALGLCISVTLVAGLILGGMEALIERLPGLLILVPSAIGMRGAIFGALGARLGTGMLTGQFELTWRRASFVGQNVEAALVLTVVTAGLLAVLARLAALALGQESINVLRLASISFVGALLSSVVVLAVVLLLARSAEGRGWDMDAIGTPIISATADLSTIPALIVGTLLVDADRDSELVTTILGAALLILAVAAIPYGLRFSPRGARRIVAESLPVLLYTGIMGVLAGTVLQSREQQLTQALLVAVPPFIAASGAIGGILSARLASRLHLGLVRPDLLPGRPALLEDSIAVLLGVIGYVAIGVLTWVASLVVRFSSPGALPLAGIMLTGGLLAVVLLAIVSYYAATASYRFGLDPDSVSIPVVTSTMDFFGILCFVAGIAIFTGG